MNSVAKSILKYLPIITGLWAVIGFFYMEYKELLDILDIWFFYTEYKEFSDIARYIYFEYEDILKFLMVFSGLFFLWWMSTKHIICTTFLGTFNERFVIFISLLVGITADFISYGNLSFFGIGFLFSILFAVATTGMTQKYIRGEEDFSRCNALEKIFDESVW
jgi:hypothetical protein